jgi:hypothetical protein
MQVRLDLLGLYIFVCFSLFYWSYRTELPSHTHNFREALDRLYRVLAVCQRVIGRVAEGLDEVIITNTVHVFIC